MVAGRVSNGPSVTVTDSPTENSTCTAGALAGAAPVGAGVFASIVGASMDMTSSRVSGTGEWVLPTNPVTPGEIGRASCRERGEVWGGAGSVKGEKNDDADTEPGKRQ